MVLWSLVVVELKVVFDSDRNFFHRYFPFTKKKEKYIDTFLYHVKLLFLKKILFIYTVPFNYVYRDKKKDNTQRVYSLQFSQ